jgi:hypothetical protein
MSPQSLIFSVQFLGNIYGPSFSLPYIIHLQLPTAPPILKEHNRNYISSHMGETGGLYEEVSDLRLTDFIP